MVKVLGHPATLSRPRHVGVQRTRLAYDATATEGWPCGPRTPRSFRRSSRRALLPTVRTVTVVERSRRS